eukprot:CAMPEP_0197534634 /NCGR_PEP_ID=MMETSP1318-20131121/47801_1 /TAXON_ID=552666 /ORGANISM="Partenskyella glossopodia, Strain RCC365" /LENGTH=175 /DNA_ID=CAMNT_0043091969 /DNA_START=227 /DNA_END=754 /DNA_ORIENTATION=-
MADDGDAFYRGKGPSVYDPDESSRKEAALNCCFVFAIFLVLIGTWQTVRARNLQISTTREHCTIVGRDDTNCYYDCACDTDNVCLQCPGVESTYSINTEKCDDAELLSKATQCLPRPQYRIGDVVQCFVPNCDEGTVYLGSPNQDYFAAMLCLALGGLITCFGLVYKCFQPVVSV